MNNKCLEKLKKLMMDQGMVSIQKEYELRKYKSILELEEVIPADIVPKCSTMVLGPDVLPDIEMFSGYREDSNTIYDKLNKCSTKGGSLLLKQILSYPTCDQSILSSRKEVLQIISHKISDPDTKQQIQTSLETMKRCEDSIYWVIDTRNQGSSLYDIIYFNSIFTRMLNKNDIVLTTSNLYKIIASPVIGILAPILYLIIPYLVFVYNFNIKMGFVEYIKLMFTFVTSFDLITPTGNGLYSTVKYMSYLMSMLFYCQGIFNSVEIAKLSYKVTSLISQHTKNIADFAKASLDLDYILWSDVINDAFLSSHGRILVDVDKSFLDSMSKTNLDTFSIFSNFGKSLNVFKHIDTDCLKRLCLRGYVLDCLYGIVVSAKENNLTCPIYQHATSVNSMPMIHVTKMFHPCLPYEKCVKNDIKLNDTSSMIVLTGPNAGGKSTLIKSLLVNIVLSQTIIYSACSNISLVPFTFINSQIHIPDSKGKESLFEAEMHRAKYNLDIISHLEPHQYAFLAIDEVFNSTNPIEGIAGAYSIMKHLASYKNTLSIFTTHYLYLTRLSKELECIQNWKMNVNISDNYNSITFPYKFTKGISRQYIALELLKTSGFDANILSDAISIKESLLSLKKT